MPKHNINFSIPGSSLGNRDAEFEVSVDNQKIGTLKISKGTIEWVPKGYTYGHHLKWTEFSDLMIEHGTK